MISTERNFYLLDYNISHSRLLYRSNEGLVNCDIVFTGVVHISTEISLSNLVLKIMDADASLKFKNDLNLPGGFKYYLLSYDEGEGVIIAGGVKMIETRLEMYETSLSDDNKDRWMILSEM